MNNIFLNNDPLLYNSQQPNTNTQNLNDLYQNMYRQQIINDFQQRSTMSQADFIGDLDKKLKALDNDVLTQLNDNQQFTELNSQLQSCVQQEIMNLVKFKLNTNQAIIDNIKKQQELIQQVEQNVKSEERQSMNELNDYMRNYSHLTFDEYKKIKSQKPNVKETTQQNNEDKE